MIDGGSSYYRWGFRVNYGTLPLKKVYFFPSNDELVFISVSSHIHMFYKECCTRNHDLTVIYHHRVSFPNWTVIFKY